MIHSRRIRQVRLVTAEGEAVIPPTIIKLRPSPLFQRLAEMGFWHHSDAAIVLMDYTDDRPFIECVIRTMFDRPSTPSRPSPPSSLPMSRPMSVSSYKDHNPRWEAYQHVDDSQR